MALRLDWCSKQAAEYAVTHWHYSRCLPSGKTVKIGVWEDDVFVGCVMFSPGANNRIGQPWGLSQTEVCELTRIALRIHQTPVSRIGRIAIRMLMRQSPGLRLLISFADPDKGHNGGVYQAMGWFYIGKSQPQAELLYNGRFLHKRSASAKFGTASPGKIAAKTGATVTFGPVQWKHVYVLPLVDDPALLALIRQRVQPYPKRDQP
jgi:hypothetical protein